MLCTHELPVYLVRGLEGVHLANKCDLRAQVRRGSEGGKAWEQGAIIKVAAASERAFSKKRLF